MQHDARGTWPAASAVDAALTLRRGPKGWQLVSTRQPWAARLLRGRDAGDAERVLPALYSLCGGAHRLVARHAVAAARGEPIDTGSVRWSEANEALRIDTLREHLRRLWLDGPRLLAGVAARGVVPDAGDMAMALARCPYLGALAPPGPDAPLGDAELAEGRRWVQQHVFGTDADDWLAAWHIDPAAVASRWSTFRPAAADTQPWPARWLAAMRQRLGTRTQAPRAVRAIGEPAPLQPIATALRADPAFALAPVLPAAQGGEPAETGCWTRAADAHARPGSTVYAPLWMRHAARLAEIAHLSGPLGRRWLAQGALALDGREGLGWCEMARGLLVHWVRLDDHGLIADYRVLAPTEWNFHPLGGAARQLADVLDGPGPLDVAQVRAVAAAYDPCVELRIEETVGAGDPSASAEGSPADGRAGPSSPSSPSRPSGAPMSAAVSDASEARDA